MILIACASFKGTLSSKQAGQALAKGLADAGMRSRVLPLADGGEGLVEAMGDAVPGARMVKVSCRGPLSSGANGGGARRKASLVLLPASRGRSRKKTAVIEMAASSGLPLLKPCERDPKHTTSLGVGDQIKAALDLGARELLLGLGGSATNDGGAGMAQALGVRLLDKQGSELPPGGAALLNLSRIDVSNLDPRLKHVKVTIACDVTNPLCGRNGASAVFGPQKGAKPADVKLLDRALDRFARIVRRDLGKNVRSIPGAGAAGGLGAGCLAFLNAELKPGIELVLDTVGFDRMLSKARLVVTGEGCLDRQTLMGKAPAGVAKRAKKAGLRCVAIGGGIQAVALPALKKRFAAVEHLALFAGSPAQAMARGAYWLRRLAKERGSEWARFI